METSTERILRERLLEVFEQATDAEKLTFVSLLIQELDEGTRRAYLNLLGDNQA